MLIKIGCYGMSVIMRLKNIFSILYAYLGHTFEKMTMQYIDYMPRKIAKENDAYFEEEENSLLACMQKGEKHG